MPHRLGLHYSPITLLATQRQTPSRFAHLLWGARRGCRRLRRLPSEAGLADILEDEPDRRDVLRVVPIDWKELGAVATISGAGVCDIPHTQKPHAANSLSYTR
jgi:hypothetical protein